MTEPAYGLPCPDCHAPAGTPCGEQPHADRERLADYQNLTHGTCNLCTMPMVYGTIGGDPTDAWHPDPVHAAACPPIPDPATHWDLYAAAVNAGLSPGHPGIEHFTPQEQP